ncbi:ribosome hibernation-promoting factor, HPF/YfiA family [Micrococcus sp.]|uniref:ribosome hibernation-promoting factor, HPF/YfiA family n=1 Tax=Micrococcus sp. TaxID=1271 RepID=UPI002A909064|nr:ribosome-associated translation inhibitor RaiA [Micrococcus sp.]MDY6055895.1 ribosome-associated translation inhibitor RaiA [Micrococcus sp.]
MTLDVSFIARGITPTEAFRDHVTARAERLETLAEEGAALEVKVEKVSRQRHSDGTIRVELTVRGPREVVRAAADGDDKIAAYDAAAARLSERLRRLRDRRKDRRAGRGGASRGAGEVAFVPPLPPIGAEQTPDETIPEAGTPVTIREKAFPATPMTAEDAVDAMELVGHDFYLFLDEETSVPSVVYRRRGWSYGLIRLDESLPADHAPDSTGTERPYRAEGGTEA